MPHNYYNHTKAVFGLAILAILLSSGPAFAKNLQFSWNASTDPSVAGYNLSYGTVSGRYTTSLNAGNSTSATVSSLIPGATYYFVVTAYNSLGLQSLPSNEVSLTVANNMPPTVSLTSPHSGDNFSPNASISVTATASDSDGTIAKVEFYQNSNKIGESTTSPYSAVWNNAPSGNYTMTALAYDDAGAAVRSAGASIQVTGASSSPTPSPTPSSTDKVRVVALTPLITAGDIAKFRLVASDVNMTEDTVVNYSISGTAVAGVNYSALSTSQMTIPAGNRGVLLPVTTLRTKGGSTTVVVTVMPGAGYTPGRMPAVVKVLGR